MVIPRTVVLAGTPSAISATAGAGTHLSVSTKDLFGLARAKGTSGVLTQVMAGTLAHTMECWQRGLESGVACGIVGRDIDARSRPSDKGLARDNARIADEWFCKDVFFTQAQSTPLMQV